MKNANSTISDERHVADEQMISEELDTLRRQYAELKAKLDNQEITNEKLILQSIRKDLDIVNKKTWISCLAGLLATCFIPLLSLQLGLRTPFIIISVVWMLLMIIGNLVRNRKLNIDSLSGVPTKRFLEEIKKRKKIQFRWIRINFPLYMFWIGYFIVECIHTGMDREILIPILIGVATGAVIGLALGYRMHNRIIGTYEGIILELENPKAAHDIIQ